MNNSITDIRSANVGCSTTPSSSTSSKMKAYFDNSSTTVSSCLATTQQQQQLNVSPTLATCYLSNAQNPPSSQFVNTAVESSLTYLQNSNNKTDTSTSAIFDGNLLPLLIQENRRRQLLNSVLSGNVSELQRKLSLPAAFSRAPQNLPDRQNLFLAGQKNSMLIIFLFLNIKLKNLAYNV